jgi:hypothetical protein
LQFFSKKKIILAKKRKTNNLDECKNAFDDSIDTKKQEK